METALLAPWVFFLFAGTLDFGYVAYSASAVENAARIAALKLSLSPPGTALDAAAMARESVCGELLRLPDVGPACAGDVVKISVAPQPFTGADGNPAIQVTVSYRTVALIPIPGLGPTGTNRWTVNRTVEARI